MSEEQRAKSGEHGAKSEKRRAKNEEPEISRSPLAALCSPLFAPCSSLSALCSLLFAAVLILGLGVRLRHYLAAPSYWYDEAFVLVNVFDKSFAELAGPLRCEQAAPPLFLWSLRALYVTAGGSEWAMRAPAFLASVLAVLAIIPLARRVAGDHGRLWAVGFAAVSQSA